jgi:5-methylcytosine-specific restriction endonuclease McrA
MAQHEGLSALHEQILELLRSHPEGLTIYQIREKFPNDPGIQQHLDRRVRDLRKYYDVPLEKGGRYVLKGEKAEPAKDSGVINAKLRAAVLNAAHGRCQMCGQTVAEDGVKLQADHKVPQTWGGETTLENLWALCQLCNGGKKDFFASFDDSEMQKIVKLESVYARIAEILRMHEGEAVPSWLLEFVANVNDFQEDWQKRLRELRYPVIGMKIKATRSKTPSGKWQAAYMLEEWKPLPENHQFLIKDFERKNKAKRKAEED